MVEDCCKGKLLYAGGDDVLALVAVDDLFDCMQLLRLAYSGISPSDAMHLGERIGKLQAGGSKGQRKLLLDKGFGLLNGRLMTLMGHKASASMGAASAGASIPHMSSLYLSERVIWQKQDSAHQRSGPPIPIIACRKIRRTCKPEPT